MHAEPDTETEPRSSLRAMWRGSARRCPRCGEGALFDGFLTARHACGVCGQRLDAHRADDLPAYLTCLLTCKATIALILAVDAAFALSDPALTAFGLVTAATLSLALLSPLKGAVIGLQWAHRMHGFGSESQTSDV